MSQEPLPFRWNARTEEAACLLAENQLNDTEIAKKAAVTRRQLDRWKHHPEFQARVDSHVEAFRQAVRSRGIAIVENRVAALDDRWKAMKQVIRERGEALAGECPGGETGLLVHQIKSIGKGDAAQIVDEYRVDDGLLAELRAHEKQAAQELQQWLDRTEQSGSVEHRHRPDLKQLTDDELAVLEHLLGKATHAGGDSAGESAAELGAVRGGDDLLPA